MAAPCIIHFLQILSKYAKAEHILHNHICQAKFEPRKRMNVLTSELYLANTEIS